MAGDAASRFRAAVVTRTVKMLSPCPSEKELSLALRHFSPSAHLQEMRQAIAREEALTRRLEECTVRTTPIIKPRLPIVTALALAVAGVLAGLMLRP